MKNKHFILLFLIGSLFIIVGAFAKIAHTEIATFSANNILAAGLGIEFVTVFFFIIKLMRNNGDWLNK